MMPYCHTVCCRAAERTYLRYRFLLSGRSERTGRIRIQLSAAHTREQLDRAIAAFIKIGKKLNVIHKFCLHTLSGVVRFRKEVSFVMPLFYL